jgi:hypothetical protein
VGAVVAVIQQQGELAEQVAVELVAILEQLRALLEPQIQVAVAVVVRSVVAVELVGLEPQPVLL